LIEIGQDVTIIGLTGKFLSVEARRYGEIHITKTARTADSGLFSEENGEDSR